MKKLKSNITEWLTGMDKSWDQLPAEKQHKYILCFFTVYLLLTAWIIFKIWYETAKFQNTMTIEHIENPLPDKKQNADLMRGSESIMLNNIYDERE